MKRQIPLNIPEILSLVAYFVPAWEGPRRSCKFIPRRLLSYALVSKSWREAMLPHLWAVYNTYHMAKIPIDVIFRYSVYFRHFDQFIDYTYGSGMPPRHWQDPTSKQPLFRCAMLKSFVLTSTSSSEQLELLRTNTGIVSLQWLNFKPDTVTVPLLNMLLPLAKTLKELTLWYHRDAQAHMPFSLLNMFTNLERLQIAPGSMMYSHEPSTPSFAAFQASAPAGSVQHMSLKQLTVMGARSTPFPFSLMTQIMSRSPNIKHLVISHINNCSMDGVHEQVIRLNAVYRAWIQSLISDAHLKALPADSAGSALESIPSDALQGLERLDILGMMSSYLRETWIRLQYERGCQDLVKISASVLSDGLNFLIPLLQQWKHMVQQVDIDCGAYITNRTAFSVLSQVLGSLTTLRRLRFVAEGGMTKQESFAIFRDKLGREDEDQGDGAGSETLVATIDDTSPAWVCQNLESLVIQGLWGTMSKDRPDKDQNALTLQAASDGHHWVAYGATKFGKQFRAIVSERIKTLPALRSLTLNRMAFDYFERGE